MKKTIIKLFVLAGFLFAGTTLSQIVTKTDITQGNKEEKCEELATCFEKFNKECLNKNFLDDFSPKIVDKFGVVNYELEMLKLDSLKYQLIGDSDLYGYIIVYGGRTNKYGEIAKRTNRIKFYLINYSKMDESRIAFIYGGFREKFEFELWISPIKNAFPPLSPTIEPEKVIFRGKMKPLPIVDY